MQYVNFGTTGLQISRLGFGGIPIQRIDQPGTRELLIAAHKAGINYIDTARAYTVSEAWIGQSLEEAGLRDDFILATKCRALTKADMEAEIATSLKNLRTDHIDVYQIHNLPEAEIDKVFGEGGAWEALEEAKAAGKIGHLGVTAHNVDALKKMLELHGDKIETVMFPYNIVEIHGHEVLKKAREMGIGTIAMKPMAGGNLDDWNLALRFIAASGVIDISIPGMGSPEEADRNAEAAEHFSPLTQEELAECDRIRKELGNEFCRRCNYCAPCTVGISIPSVFLFQGYLNRYGLQQWGRERYATLQTKAGACIRCGACEPRCPYNLPIRQMMQKAAEDFGE